jgi:hypothetical protein
MASDIRERTQFVFENWGITRIRVVESKRMEIKGD